MELTETSAVSDLHDAQRFIESMRETGVRVCLDDFGVGFSSFAYLQHLDVDMLKIDGQFIRDLPTDRDNQVFVKGHRGRGAASSSSPSPSRVEDGGTVGRCCAASAWIMAQGYHLEEPTGAASVAQRSDASKSVNGEE